MKKENSTNDNDSILYEPIARVEEFGGEEEGSRSKEGIALSVPSDFYFTDTKESLTTTGSKSGYPFFIEDSDRIGATLIPSADFAAAKTRLQVLHAWEVNAANLMFFLASILAVGYVIFSLNRIIEIWSYSGKLPPLTWAEETIQFLLRATAFLFAFVFTLSIVAHWKLTQEQFWTAILLWVGILCSSPLASSNTGEKHSFIRESFDKAVFSSVVYLYLLLSAHSYRMLDGKPSFIYKDKIAFILFYFSAQLCFGIIANVSFGFAPFTQIFMWARLLVDGLHFFRVTLAVILSTALDLRLLICILHELELTSSFLTSTPYLEHREKQLGFRCFVYQSTLFFTIISFLTVYPVLIIPSQILHLNYRGILPSTVIQLYTPAGSLGLHIAYFAWTSILAYVTLPPRSVAQIVRYRISKLRRLFLLAFNKKISILAPAADNQSCFIDEEYLMESFQCHSNHYSESYPCITPLRYLHREWSECIDSKSQNLYDLRNQYINERLSGLIEVKRKDMLAHCEDQLRGTTGYGDREANAKMLIFSDCPSDAGFVNNFAIPGVAHYPEYRLLDCSSERSCATQLRNKISEKYLSNDCYDNFTASRFINRPPNERFEIAINIREGDLAGIVGASHEGMNRNVLFNHIKAPHLKNSQTKSLRHLQNIYKKNSSKTYRRLNLRKNLFVMETQVLLAQAAYLSYIPGNPKEEPSNQRISTARLLNTAASRKYEELFPDDLKDVIGSESRMNFEPYEHKYFDDGTMFLVEPSEAALENGFAIFRQISNLSNSTHATVLLGHDRVIVSFSGTRDSKNWATNSKIGRSVLHKVLPSFEYELAHEAEGNAAKEGHLKYQKLVVVDELTKSGAMTNEINSEAIDKNRANKMNVRRSHSELGISSLRFTQQNSNSAVSDLSTRAKTKYGSMDMPIFRNMRRKRSFRNENLASTMAHELMTLGQAKVHSGFVQAYLCVRKQLMGALVELFGGDEHFRYRSSIDEHQQTPLAKGLPLFFCGHSLGGALATFAAYESAKYSRKIGLISRQQVSCTTFGCPMVGNAIFKKQYERLVETHWRFEIASDPVHSLPSSILNYTHVGVRVLLDRNGFLIIDPSLVEVNWWGSTPNLYVKYKLHARASYIRALHLYCQLYKDGEDDLDNTFWTFPIKVQTNSVFQQ